MANRYLHARKKAVAVALVLCALPGCSYQEELAKAQAIAADLYANKQLVESLVSDIKKNYSPTDSQYRSVLPVYSVAKASLDTYLATATLAVTSGDKKVALGEAAAQSQKATADFVQVAQHMVFPDSKGVVLPLLLAALPSVIHGISSLVPRRERLAAARALTDQLRFRSWEECDDVATPAPSIQRSIGDRSNR